MSFDFYSNYTWYELWGPFTFIAVALISYLYVKHIVISKRYQVTNTQIQYFFSAAVIFYLIKGSPFKVIADNYLFSAHITELMMLLFAVIPLLILSMPTELLRKYFWHHRMKNAIKLFGHPWLTALLFNGALSAYFVPAVFNTVQQSMLLTFVSHTVLILTAFLMWWTVIIPLPEVSNFSYFVRVAYVFLNSVLLMPIGVFLLIVISQAHYPFYEAVATEIFPSMNAVYDQQLGGGLLKAIQLTSYGIALFYLIINWSKKEEEKEGQVDDENIRVVQGVVIHLPERK